MSNNAFNINENWNLLIIDDAPKLLPGKSIVEALQLLVSIVKFNFIITDEMEGIGEEIYNLKCKKNDVIEFNQIFPLIYTINQIEWGDFFLFKKYPADWSNSQGELYPSLIAKSDTTLRAVDNQYLYIYTPYNEIVEALKQNYSIEEIKVGVLETLDYPY